MKILTIIIVHYHFEEYLHNCLDSLFKEKISFPYEVIVIDNDEKIIIKDRLLKRFPTITYLRPLKSNPGFSVACNLGAQKAEGKYLFFLNPDTIIQPQSITRLVNFLEKRKQFAVVAPLLLNQSAQPYPFQGTNHLTPLSALFAFSFLNKIFPNSSVSNRFWLKEWNKENLQEVAVVPGSAFLIRRSVFLKIGGFDEHFFLYFEESDLCRRVGISGWRLAILPQAKVIHFWCKSTPQNLTTKQIFRQSRFYYFRKNFGVLRACVVELFLRGGECLAPLF